MLVIIDGVHVSMVDGIVETGLKPTISICTLNSRITKK